MLKRLLILMLVLAAGAVAGATAWLHAFATAALPLPQTPFEFSVARGTSLKALSAQLHAAGLLPDEQRLWWLGRVTEQARGIQAGRYRLDTPLTPLALLKKLNDGDVIPVLVTFVEGSTFRDLREQLAANKAFRQTLAGLTDREILAKLGATETHPEGLFFPDTYRFVDGASDFDVLKKAYQTMHKKLAEAWAAREEGLPYKNAYQALIMASIIEKETGQAGERALIGSVFVNRLRIPMRLQTDPTVIYGMGERFDGNIRRRDLETDTPYNTYTRDGLPPTPIAMPGWDSLVAATRPAKSDRLYFVAKGDGSHYFSASLAEHNRAVAKYQLKK
ncbi:MAG TPA: endolytic transglycosylase MltG [Usitatibacteraceae bacterium]|nr:endolytic transglycosylase MltG [Usitatibacteraceae bacterium]